MPVRPATCGRLFRTRRSSSAAAKTSRGASASIRVTTTACPSATASSGNLFVLSKGSPNSERDAPVAKRSGWVSTKYELRSSRKTPRERIQFFNSFKRAMKMYKKIIAFAAMLFGMTGWAGDSEPFLLDTTDPLITAPIIYNSSWIGDDSSAEVFKEWKYTVEDGKATIVETMQKSGSVTIPSEIDGYPVTSIGENAFAYCLYLNSVTMPEGVTSVGYQAFMGCPLLTNITFPKQMEQIEPGAFYQCTGLKVVTLPEGIRELSEYLFYQCTSLEKVVIPSTVTKIGPYVFQECNSLRVIEIPAGVTEIDEQAFLGSNLTDTVIVTESGSYAEEWAKNKGCRVIFE